MFIRKILQFGAGMLIPGIVLVGISGCSPTRTGAQEPSTKRSDTMAESINNKKIGEPVVSRQVLLQIEREAALEPKAIVQAEDGGFIIVGGVDATKQGWAAKTDGQGKVLWHYFRDLQEEDKKELKSQLLARPDFIGAVAMPDGSIFLCGNMPNGSRPGTPSVFTTHLDSNGLLISEKFFIPEKEVNKGIKPKCIGCVRWGDGFVIVGNITGPYIQTTKTVAPSMGERWYWVLMFDGAGEKKWEKYIPVSLMDNINFSRSLHIANSNLMFSALSIENTELLSISATGEILEKKIIKGEYQFVRPVVSDGIIQLYGRPPGGDSRNRSVTDGEVVVTVDEQFNEIHSTQKGLENFVGYLFRMPDKSIVSIGSKKHSFGKRYASGVVLVDQFLQNERYIELPHTRAPFGDDGDTVASSTKTPDIFVRVRGLVIVGEGKAPGNMPPDFKRGAELDFIQIQ